MRRRSRSRVGGLAQWSLLGARVVEQCSARPAATAPRRRGCSRPGYDSTVALPLNVTRFTRPRAGDAWHVRRGSAAGAASAAADAASAVSRHRVRGRDPRGRQLPTADQHLTRQHDRRHAVRERRRPPRTRPCRAGTASRTGPRRSRRRRRRRSGLADATASATKPDAGDQPATEQRQPEAEPARRTGAGCGRQPRRRRTRPGTGQEVRADRVAERCRGDVREVRERTLEVLRLLGRRTLLRRTPALAPWRPSSGTSTSVATTSSTPAQPVAQCPQPDEVVAAWCRPGFRRPARGTAAGPDMPSAARERRRRPRLRRRSSRNRRGPTHDPGRARRPARRRGARRRLSSWSTPGSRRSAGTRGRPMAWADST